MSGVQWGDAVSIGVALAWNIPTVSPLKALGGVWVGHMWEGCAVGSRELLTGAWAAAMGLFCNAFLNVQREGGCLWQIIVPCPL